jgi:hypothetical protein
MLLRNLEQKLALHCRFILSSEDPLLLFLLGKKTIS